MVFRCDVARDVSDGTLVEGAYEGEPDFQPHLTDVYCYYWLDVRRSSGEQESPQRQSEIDYIRMIMPADTDITSDDRITQIRRRNGEVMIDYDLDITSLQRELGHLLLQVEQRR